MTKPAMITVAITGSQPRKRDNPALPVTPDEQVEATQAAFEAGATLLHLHVRDAEENASADTALFAEVQEGVRKHCPGMVIQFTTGGLGRGKAERLRPLELAPDMATFSTGSVNFGDAIFENPPALIDELAQVFTARGIKPEIEVFDLSMLYKAHQLADAGQISRPLHVQFVLGVRNALPVRRSLLEFLVRELAELEPDATWAAAGIGRHQLEVNLWCLELGGHCRTGFEDNIRFDAGRLASSNAELVGRVARLCGEYDRRPASVEETRRILGLAPAGQLSPSD